jgi:hypothetical protein
MSTCTRVAYILRGGWRRYDTGTNTGQPARTPIRESSGMRSRWRRRHDQGDQTAQRRLGRSRNCALLARRQPRRRRDHRDRADVDVPNSAQRLHNGWRGHRGRTGHADHTSRGNDSRFGCRGNARSLRQTEVARGRLVNLGRRSDHRSRTRWYGQSRGPEGRERHHRGHRIRGQDIGTRRPF